jgi:hypothetical protein
VRHVEHATTAADRTMLGERALVLERHLPAAEVGESGPQTFVRGVQR